MDPFRNETMTDLLIRKRENRPLNILVHKHRGESGNRFYTLLTVSVRYNYTALDPSSLEDGIFASFPTGRGWNISDDPLPTRSDVQAAIDELALVWSSYQVGLPVQWNVTFDGEVLK